MSIGAWGNVSTWGFADGHVKTMDRKATMIQEYPWTAAHVTARAKNLFHYDDRFKS
jgi:prepilin-type processing-associated H-X9-DG protein